MKRKLQRIRFGHRKIELAKISFFRYQLRKWALANMRDFPWRSRRASLYERILSEILLQRTRAETVAAFWPLFITRFPSWNVIAGSTRQEIQEVLKPLGLSAQRAPRLHSLATILAKSNGCFPRDRILLEEMPGVGQYIANAIMTFAHQLPHPLLDTNMARVV